jgi:hypothetical protein
MPVVKIQNWLARAEEIIEDVILAILSVFVIILAISAIAIMGTQTPVALAERVGALESIMQLGFLAKAEYIAALLTPWIAMIIGLLIARELWLSRRRLEGIHFEMVLNRVRGSRAARPVRSVRRMPVRRASKKKK